MSAFIVSDETMHRVVQALDLIKHADDYLELGDKIKTLAGQRLFAMNNDALRERYGDRYPEDLTDPAHYQYQHVEATPGALYRAVACFTYQCMEGNVPSSELYKLVAKVEEQLAATITGEPVDSPTLVDNAMRMTEDQPWDF
jgi:hypothetical protein